MDTIDKDISWYALNVRPRFEKVVSRNLRGKGFEEFLPVYNHRTRWSDRMKDVELPLFPGYVFCKFDVTQRLPILTIPGVNCVVGIGKTPVSISSSELDDVRTLVQSGAYCEPWQFLQQGQIVEIEYGPMAGMQGFVVRAKNLDRFVISVNLLQRSVAVEIDRNCLKAVSKPKSTMTENAANPNVLVR